MIQTQNHLKPKEIAAMTENIHINETPPIPRMLSIKAAAREFGLAEHFIRQCALSGKCAAVRAGNSKILVNAASLCEYLSNSTLMDELSVEPVGIRSIR